MTTVRWSSLLGALARVERLGESDSGLLSFGDDPIGGIFVEQGRVCWVAARGLERRLRALLSAHSRMSTEELERMYERCRAEGRLLGETLVDEGLLAPSDLQQALRRHSAECLVELCSSPRTTSWWSHSGRGYAPRFTFRAVDLLFDSVALVFPELHASALSELARVEGPDRKVAAFVRDEESGTLLPLAEGGGYDVGELQVLGRDVGALPRACHELGATPSFVVSTTGDGRSVVVWWDRELLFAVSCADRACLAALTALRLTLQETRKETRKETLNAERSSSFVARVT